MKRKVTAQDVTSGAEAPEAALEDEDTDGRAPTGAEITAGEAAPEEVAAPSEPDPDATAG